MTTDTEEDGATPEDPVETSLTSPNGGTVSITESTIEGDPPAGFEFLGQQVTIEAPDATAGDPLVIVIRIDASLIPVGEDENSIQVFKDGSQVADCTGAPGTADPDPCVSSRVLLGDGDVEITILTSTASVWNFGVALVTQCHDLNNDGKVSGRDVSIVARAIFSHSGSPRWNPDADLNNDGVVDLLDLKIVISSLVDSDCR